MTNHNGILEVSVKHYIQILTLLAYAGFSLIVGDINTWTWVSCGAATLWATYLMARMSGHLRLWQVYEEQDGIREAVRQDMLDNRPSDVDLATYFERDDYIQALHQQIHQLRLENINLKEKLSND